MTRNFTISDLAREFAVTPRALRHYEAEGLLAPVRDGQKRVYSARDRVRLALLLRGRRLGFTLAAAKELIDLYSAPQGEVAQLELLPGRLAGKRALLEEIGTAAWGERVGQD